MLQVDFQAKQFLLAVTLLGSLLLPTPGLPSEAQLVMDAKSGAILFDKNAELAMQPAGLAKLMTLYLVFEAVAEGQLSMNDEIPISVNAATEPPVALGLTEVVSLELRYLIRAAAVKGANDAATALAEAVAGSEPEFVDLMNVKAQVFGMNDTYFTNAHGLTEEGITTTALDVAVLFRALNNDFQQYMNIFARRSTDAGIDQIEHSGRQFFDISQNVAAVKTGYTKEAKFNAVVLAEHNAQQLIIVGLRGDSIASLKLDVRRLAGHWLGN
jgi:D-alanyl-D-alanine carboxypeptidase